MPPIGRSAQELPIEYQVEALFINFSVSIAEKGCREGPGSGILRESLVKATISTYLGVHTAVPISPNLGKISVPPKPTMVRSGTFKWYQYLYFSTHFICYFQKYVLNKDERVDNHFFIVILNLVAYNSHTRSWSRHAAWLTRIRIDS